MQEDIKEYGISILEDTQVAMEPEGLIEEAFAEVILNDIAPLIDCTEPVIKHCVLYNTAKSILGEIHGYAESSNGEVLYLFYALFNPLKEVASKNNTEVQPYLNRAQGFYKRATQACYEAYDSSTAEYAALKYIYDNNYRYKSINIILLSNYMLPNVEIKKISVTTRPVYLNVWDLGKLYDHTHAMRDHIAINIDFNSDEYKKYKIMYLQMESEQFGYKCIQALFPAKLIYDLYQKYNTNLLYNNVRLFLGLKGSKDKKPNVAMRDTLKDENEMFLAYNNGLTALAKSVEGLAVGEKTDVTENGNTASVQYITMGELKKIMDFRVVNGGQTCATIFHAREASKNSTNASEQVNLLGVYVQVKIIVSDDIEKFATKITKSTNFQNTIKIPDFSASNAFNMALEKLSRTISIPNSNNDLRYWFYERLRGEYEAAKKTNHTKYDQVRFESKYPAKLKFLKEDVAKVWCSWDGMPYDAVKGASTAYGVFMKKMEGLKIIPDETFYKVLIAKLIIFRFLKDRPENKGYGNGKATVMAYSLAMMQQLTHGDDILWKIWNAQEVPENIMAFLNAVSDKVYQSLQTGAEENGSTILSYGKTKTAFDNLLRQKWSEERALLEE